MQKNIGAFHQKHIQSIETLNLSKVLKRKNPYLFKAKYVLTADEIIRGIINAHISSNEETIFGNWLEELAIFINKQVYGGYKSGPNWENSSQITKMIADSKTAKKHLEQVTIN